MLQLSTIRSSHSWAPACCESFVGRRMFCHSNDMVTTHTYTTLGIRCIALSHTVQPAVHVAEQVPPASQALISACVRPPDIKARRNCSICPTAHSLSKHPEHILFQNKALLQDANCKQRRPTSRTAFKGQQAQTPANQCEPVPPVVYKSSESL